MNKSVVKSSCDQLLSGDEGEGGDLECRGGQVFWCPMIHVAFHLYLVLQYNGEWVLSFIYFTQTNSHDCQVLLCMIIIHRPTLNFLFSCNV